MTDEQINECGCYKCCEHVKKPMNPYGLEKDACQLSDDVLLLEEVVKCPKKNKYRIGDKVKVVSHESHNGKVGEITRIKDGKEKPYGVYFGGDFPLYFSESELESDFKLDRKRGGAMFRVGDKVKIPWMDRCGELIGIEDNGRWRILLDDGTFAFVCESEFKPIENPDQLNPKFKVGNHVTCIDKGSPNYHLAGKILKRLAPNHGELGIKKLRSEFCYIVDGMFGEVVESALRFATQREISLTQQLNIHTDKAESLLQELREVKDETLSAEEIDKCINDCADEFATIVHKGERYNPSKVDGIVKSFTEQIRVAYERGYKDGNFDGQAYAYNKGYADGRSEQHKEDSTYNTYLRGYNDAIDDFMKRAKELKGGVNDE